MSAASIGTDDRRVEMAELDVEMMNHLKLANKAFKAAIDFALDGADEGLLFLAMWNEGNWVGIANEFPSFDLSTIESE